MKQNNFPKFTVINKILKNTLHKMHPSEAHGLLCGLLCGQSNQLSSWIAMIAGEKTVNNIQEELKDLYTSSYNLLNEFSFDFYLLLPGENVNLSERAFALIVWCQGFLTGLKRMNITFPKKTEENEAIQDLLEISKINAEEVVSNEEDETAYVELVEYVRMAIVLIYNACRKETPLKAEATSSLH